MVRRTILLSLLATAISAGSAQAVGICKPGNGTVHCYDVAYLQREQHRAVIIAVQLQASMKVGFATAETWANMPNGGQFGDWIEVGLMVWPPGEKGDLRPHAFYATEHGGQFYAHIDAWPAATVSAPRYYYAISDPGSNGCFQLNQLLSSEQGSFYWKFSAGAWAEYCGRAVAPEYLTAGGEAEVEEGTRILGHSEVAWSDQENGQRYVQGWTGWSPYFTSYKQDNPEIAMQTNPEGPGPGNLEWRTAALPGASAAAATASTATVKTGMTVLQGKSLSAKLKLTAPIGSHKPHGEYRATYRNGEGRVEDEYVGNTYPSETALRKAGAQ